MEKRKAPKALAVAVAAITIAVLLAPVAAAEASSESYYYITISVDDDDGTITIDGDYTSIGGATGTWSSADGSYTGSWGFDEDGYGPFNSFYAAFDPAADNAMVCILDPDDLTKSITGEDISGFNYNIMWVLPTVYWYTDDGALVLTNDPDDDGTAYAHTIDDDVYDYIAIGVYEASTIDVDGETYLASVSGATPATDYNRSTYRSLANSQTVEDGAAMLWNFYQYELYRYCALIVMGSWDSQSVVGNGNVYGGVASTTGTLDTAGPYAGTVGTESTDYSDAVKLFIENAWGSVAEMVDGIIVRGVASYYIDTNYIPLDSDDGDNVSTVTSHLDDSGWITGTSTTTKIWGMPNESSDDYDEDEGMYDYYTTTGTRDRVLVVGGSAYGSLDDVLMYGLAYFDASTYGLNSSSDTSDDDDESEESGDSVGTRLAFVYSLDDDGIDLVWIVVIVAAIAIAAVVCVWAYLMHRQKASGEPE